jgi:DNA topoisomerase-1
MKGNRTHLRLVSDPVESAKAAGLRYVTDQQPGICRVRVGERFVFRDPQGVAIRDRTALARIRSLALPPAWTDVWICPAVNGHLQATGRDAKGRKQYRYHARWREVRDETKYWRMLAFSDALPRIRRRTSQDMAKPGLPREKVLAAVVQLLEKTLIRIGNGEYARENGSFGLTTLRDRHAEVSGSKLRFEFRGKGGKRHVVEVSDRRLARIVEQCQDIPGYELFQYVDEASERHTIDSSDVNDYLREIAEREFTAKDFRTWAGTVLAALALREFGAADSETEARRNVVRAIERVAERLGNTPAVCRKCYVHPEIINAYLEGATIETIERRDERILGEEAHELEPEEAAVAALLKQRLKELSRAA